MSAKPVPSAKDLADGLVKPSHGSLRFTGCRCVERSIPMSDLSPGEGWWLVSDGKRPSPPDQSRTFDFDDGEGPVAAHRHPNGGGWIANSASVANSAFVGPSAVVRS